MQAIERWPVRELLLAFIECWKDSALASYRHAQTMWAILAPHSGKNLKPPKVPRILK
jgi:hypothetical protein